jgi:hypothetical protein
MQEKDIVVPELHKDIVMEGIKKNIYDLIKNLKQ